MRAILQNQAYVGTFVRGRRREGKYHRAAGTEILQRDRHKIRVSRRGKPGAIDNPEDGWIVVENAHEIRLLTMLNQPFNALLRTDEGFRVDGMSVFF